MGSLEKSNTRGGVGWGAKGDVVTSELYSRNQRQGIKGSKSMTSLREAPVIGANHSCATTIHPSGGPGADREVQCLRGERVPS